jgi:hypothetical protein
MHHAQQFLGLKFWLMNSSSLLASYFIRDELYFLIPSSRQALRRCGLSARWISTAP